MRCLTIGLLLCAIGIAGCTGNTTPTAAPQASTGQTPSGTAATVGQGGPAPQPVAVPANAAPEQVVMVFLNAMRTGDSPTTESLLTFKARQELARHQLSVDVQSAPNAT